MLALIAPYSCNLISIDRLLMEMESDGCLFHQARSATKIILRTGSWTHSLLETWGSKKGQVRNGKQRDLLSDLWQSDKSGGSGLVWAQLSLKPSFKSAPNHGCEASQWERAYLKWAWACAGHPIAQGLGKERLRSWPPPHSLLSTAARIGKVQQGQCAPTWVLPSPQRNATCTDAEQSLPRTGPPESRWCYSKAVTRTDCWCSGLVWVQQKTQVGTPIWTEMFSSVFHSTLLPAAFPNVLKWN